MTNIHPTRIVDSSAIEISYSLDGSHHSYIPFANISNYNFSLDCQSKEIISITRSENSVAPQFSDSYKLSIKSTLNFNSIDYSSFRLPDRVWIKISLLIRELANCDRVCWIRSGEFLLLSDVVTSRTAETVNHQYSLVGQRAISYTTIITPTINTVVWTQSQVRNADIETSQLNSSRLIFIL